MARRKKIPVTPAVRALKTAGVLFELYPYRYIEKGGTAQAAKELGVTEHMVIKTLVMEDQDRTPFLVLMHGDRKVSAKAVARELDKKTIRPCDEKAVHRHTGYLPGGVSPFGTRKRLPVCLEASVRELDIVLINAGKRGLLAELRPVVLEQMLKPTLIDAAIS